MQLHQPRRSFAVFAQDRRDKRGIIFQAGSGVYARCTQKAPNRNVVDICRFPLDATKSYNTQGDFQTTSDYPGEEIFS
jgi:hypothetical protein